MESHLSNAVEAMAEWNDHVKAGGQQCVNNKDVKACPSHYLLMGALQGLILPEFVAFRAYLVCPENWRTSGATSRGIGMTACI